MKKRILAMIMGVILAVSSMACGTKLEEKEYTSESIAEITKDRTVVLDGKTFNLNETVAVEEKTQEESTEKETETISKDVYEELSEIFEKTFESENLTMACKYMESVDLTIIKAVDCFLLSMKNGDRLFEMGGYQKEETEKVYLTITAPDENGKLITLKQRSSIDPETAEEENLDLNGVMHSFGVNSDSLGDKTEVEIVKKEDSYEVRTKEGDEEISMICYVEEGYLTKIQVNPIEEQAQEQNMEPVIFTINREAKETFFNDEEYEEIDAEGIAWAMLGGMFTVLMPTEEEMEG